jgi:hypothetical protein
MERLELKLRGERVAAASTIRLSLFRERLAWGVSQRATLLTPQQDVVNTPREKFSNRKEKHRPCHWRLSHAKGRPKMNDISDFQILTAIQ